jgi:uncharacterized protein
MKNKQPALDRLISSMLRRPFRDENGCKGWLEKFAHADQHIIQKHSLTISGWPQLSRPLRIVFLSDFHVGSHTNDIDRIRAIGAEAAGLAPDLVLLGGDYVNMQPIGGGRIPPNVIAQLLAPIVGLHGTFAVLGNHDYLYGEMDVSNALRDQGIAVLRDDSRTINVDGRSIEIIGIPDANVIESPYLSLLGNLSKNRPTIILAHDPAWFMRVPAGPFLTLAGHTHGGQIKIPWLGILKNSSRAPLRWSHGLVVEGGRHLYVSAGLGTSVIPLRIGVPPEYAVIDINGNIEAN